MGARPIKFGTSGWRAEIAREFTFANVRIAVAAVAGHVLAQKKNPTVLVGCDPRFDSEAFVAEAAAVLAANGVRVQICQGFAPTPAIAYEILRRKADGAINFTASHNPAQYHGLKFSGADGAPAQPEATKDIEARAATVQEPPAVADAAAKAAAMEHIDCRPTYLARLRELVRFPLLRESKLTFAYSARHGCGAGYLDRLLQEEGVAASTIQAGRDVLFDGSGPDVSEEYLRPLAAEVKAKKAAAGLATDGDADRFGIVDADGSYVSANHVLALVYDYLVESRGWKLGVTRSVATTHLLDAVAKFHGQPVYETPVGFKYVGENVKQDKIALGGEESAGLTIRGHVPEKDGILACLLVAEMTAARRSSLQEQLKALFRKVGVERWPIRGNLHLNADVQSRTLERLKKDPTDFAGHKVKKLDRTDGLKLILEDGSWILMRASGTEPILRVYTEAASQAASQGLLAAAEKWIES